VKRIVKRKLKGKSPMENLTYLTENDAIENELNFQLGKLQCDEHEKAFALVEEYSTWGRIVMNEYLAKTAVLALRFRFDNKSIARFVWDAENMNFN